MPEIAWTMVPTTSLSSATWPSISCARSRQRAPYASRSSGPDGRTHISPKSSLKFEVRSPWAMDTDLKERADDDAVQAGLDAAHKRVGELSMEVELLRAKIGRLEAGTPFPRARSRR